MAKVSVIIPVYNTEKYLRQCLKSIMKQSLSDIEIICVDDGSTDSSPKILDSFAKKDKRIRVIHKSNAGYGHTVNTGIRNAKGEFIGVVDSDDYISAEMYEELFKKAREHDLDFVKSDFYEIRSYRDKVYRKKITAFDDPDMYESVINPQENSDVFNFVTMNIWTGIYRRDFIKKNNIRFNESPGAAFQDSGFWFQTLCTAKRIMFDDGAYYRYRRDNPNSSVNDRSKVYDIIKEYGFIKRFLVSHPAAYERFHKIYVIQKYYAYMDAYMRIGDEFRSDFLCKCADEFSEDIKSLKCDPKELDEHAFKEMLRITDDPLMYYYESTIDECNRKYTQMQKDAEMVKSFVKKEDV